MSQNRKINTSCRCATLVVQFKTAPSILKRQAQFNGNRSRKYCSTAEEDEFSGSVCNLQKKVIIEASVNGERKALIPKLVNISKTIVSITGSITLQMPGIS